MGIKRDIVKLTKRPKKRKGGVEWGGERALVCLTIRPRIETGRRTTLCARMICDLFKWSFMSDPSLDLLACTGG